MNINKIKEDFPIFENKKDLIYFDSACMSLKPKQVVDKTNEYYYEYSGCVGRSMHSLGEEATSNVEEARKKLSKFFGAKKDKEIIFTRNTTEGINLVANSLNIKGGVVITGDKEHNSNLLPWIRLKDDGEIDYKIAESNEDNSFSIENFEKLIHEGNVRLVSITHSANLDGMSAPLKEITKIAHDAGAKVLVDAAQSAPHTELNVKKMDVDFLACSGHKMLGPSGIGMLYGKEEELNNLNTFLLGGETVTDSRYDSYDLEGIPHKFEAGLQNYSGMIGFGAATDYLKKIGMNNIHSHEIKLNKMLTEGLKSFPINMIGNTDPEKRGGVLSFYSEKVDPHEIALMLNSHNIMVRSGAFCVHSWFNKHNLPGAVRFSSYLYNSEEDCKKVIDFFNDNLKGLL